MVFLFKDADGCSKSKTPKRKHSASSTNQPKKKMPKLSAADMFDSTSDSAKNDASSNNEEHEEDLPVDDELIPFLAKFQEDPSYEIEGK